MNPLAIAFQFVGMALFPAMAVIWFTTAFVGKTDPRTPRCGSCRETLGFLDLANDKPCRACGARPSERPPVPDRRRPARRPLIAAIVYLALAFPLAWIGSALQRRPLTVTPTIAAIPKVMAMTSADAREVSATKAAVRDGAIPHAALRDALRSALATGAVPLQTPATLELAALALDDPNATPEALAPFWDTILQSGMSPATPTAQFLETTSPTLMLDPTREPPGDAPLGRVAVLRGVWIDGVDVAPHELAPHVSGEPLLLPLGIRRFESGERTLRVSLETFLYTAFDLERIGARSTHRMPESDWPAPLARRVVESTVTFTAP